MPCGKISNGKHYSIITDHLGTPIEAYNQEGELIWEREQDLYGNSRQGFAKENFRCPFKYQGQYYDSEVELCYNRFRYYHPETGRYISEDPIGFLSGEPNFFAYVSDTNAWVDLLGLEIVYALFEMNGEIFDGVNPTDREDRKKGTIEELEHLGWVNKDTFSMHVEIEAMKKAKDKGLRGGKAVLMVDGKNVCASCRPAIMDFARSMGITEIEIHELNSGKVYVFKEDEINKEKNGKMHIDKIKK